MYDVVTIGTATRDVFLESPSFKIVRDPAHLGRLGFPTGEAQCFALGGKLEVEAPIFDIGGGAANTAVTFSRMGFKTKAVAKIGSDPNGVAVVADLKKEGIAVAKIKNGRHPTSYSVVLRSPSGERTILVYRGASEDLKPADFEPSDFKTKWAYIVPGHLSEVMILKAVKKFKKNGTKVAMNPSMAYLSKGLSGLSPFLKLLDVFILNREEAAYLTGYGYDDETAIIKSLHEHVSGLVVMTEGAKGAVVSNGSRLFRAETFKEKTVVDTTGAGDAFGSAFVSGLIGRNMTDDSIIEAIRMGAANATSVIENVGAQNGILDRKTANAARWKNLKIKIEPYDK